MNPQLAAALAQAKQTNQAVPVNMGTYTLMAYPNGQVGPQGGGGTARWTPQGALQIPQQPVQPSAGVQGLAGGPSGPAVMPSVGSTITWPPWPFKASSPAAAPGAAPQGYAGVQGLPGSPSGPAVGPQTSGPSYTDPTTLQTYSAVPGSTSISVSGPGYGNGTVVPATLPTTQPSPAPAGPVDRHDPVAAQARVYRINHGISTPDDSAATDALNAESLAAANAGRTYLNRDLAAQYGQAPAAGTVGPRTDVVNALLMPQTTTGTAYAQQQPTTQSPYARQPIVLAPTTTQPAQAQQPVWYSVGQRYASGPAAAQQQNNSLLAQGIY